MAKTNTSHGNIRVKRIVSERWSGPQYWFGGWKVTIRQPHRRSSTLGVFMYRPLAEEYKAKVEKFLKKVKPGQSPDWLGFLAEK